MKRLSAVLLILCHAPGQAKATGELPLTPALEKIFAGGEPQTLADVKAMETYLQALRKKVLPTIVHLGGATGVIVDGGYILTSGHVTRTPDRVIQARRDNGKRVSTRSLGLSNLTDTGVLKVARSQSDLPCAEMGESSNLKPGQWCVMFGYPGGRRPGSTPPLRLGRVLRVVDPGRGYLVTDCTMSAGDSGGPLFDMHGRVIGINSRINRNLQHNMHTPIDAFRKDWQRLLAGEVMGRSPGRRGKPAQAAWLGAEAEMQAESVAITSVVKGSPADKAGVRPGDVLLRVNNRRIYSPRTLRRRLERLWPGDRARLKVRRGDKELALEAFVVKAPKMPKPKPTPKRIKKEAKR